MNEEALQDAYKLFAAQGYNGDINQFIDLISANPEALQDAHKIFSAQGYNGDINQFKTLIGVGQQPQQPVQQPLVPMSPLKKKEASTSPSEGGVLERYGFNAKRALGQEEEQPVMLQPLPERLQPTQKKDSKTWERETALPEVITGYTKPVEEVSLLRPEEKPAEEPLGLIGRYVPERDEKKTPKFIEETLSALTPDRFNLTGTDTPKQMLEYYLKDMGFKIEDSDKSSSYTGKYVDIVSPRGERYPFYIGNDIIRTETNGYFGLPSNDDINQLKDFIRAETFSDSGIAKKQYLYEKENKKIIDKKQIDDEVSKLSQDAEAFKNEVNAVMGNQTSIEEMANKLNNFPENLRGTNQYNMLVEEYNKMVESNKKAYDELEKKRQDLIANESALKVAAGNYVKMKESQGSFTKAMWNKATGGVGKTLSGLYDLQIEQSLNTGITGFIGNYVIGKDWDNLLKTIKYGGYDDKKILPFNPKESLRGIFTSLLGDREVSDEYMSKMEREGNIVQRGLLGLAESAPAMLGGPAAPVLMGAMVTDALDQEMMNDPDLKDLSEMEKMMIKAPIGIVSGILEKVGLKGAIKGTSIIKSLTGRAISKLPINATAADLRIAALNEIRDMGIKGTVALTGSALSEAETGALQQMAEYGIKDIYNLAKGKNMFDTPEFFSQKYFDDVIDAALTEAVGGVVIGVPNSIATALKKDGFRGLDDETFKIFESLSKDNDSKKFFVTDLKNKINRGEITPQQGKQILDAYNEASGMIGVVPDEITDIESRKIAMDLLSERKKLEAKKQGKDEALAKPIQDKINKINEQLSKLTEDAIQKQTGIPTEISNLKDDEIIEFTVKSLDEIPEQFRDRANKKKEGVKVEVGRKIFGLPIGPKKETIIGEAYTYSLTGKEAKDYAIQKQAAGEVSVQPEAGVGQEVEIGGTEAKPKITPEESKRKEDLLKALEATTEDIVVIGDEMLDRKDAQAELEAITQKEQAPIAEQGGMEQAPAKMPTTDIIIAAPTEAKAGVTFVAPDGNEVALEGNEQVAAQLYDDAMAVAEEQRTPEQNDIIQKMQPIVAAAPAVEVAPVTEVTPAEQFTEQDRARKEELTNALAKADKRRKNVIVGETTMTKAEAKAELDALTQKEQAAQQPAAVEVAPTEVAPTETRTPEQEADLLEELLTGKKKEPVAEEVDTKKTTAKRIRDKKIKGALSSIDFGISQALYNGALDFMANQVEKGTKLGNAIENTIKWIDEKMQGKSWDKDGFTKYANTTFEEVATKKKAKAILDVYPKGSVVGIAELASESGDTIISNVLSKMKDVFNKVKISGRRPTEGAAFYNYNTKEIDVNKNSPHWDEVEGDQIASALSHEFAHHLIDGHSEKEAIETDLQEIKDDLIANKPELTERQKKAYEFMTSKNNSPQEILTYAVSDPDIRPILTKYKDKLNNISNKLFGEDVISGIFEEQKTKKDEIQSQRTRDGRGRTESRAITPLEGAPSVPGFSGPDPQLTAVAEKYAEENGIPYKRQGEYVKVDENRAKRIAQAYEEMKHDPQNPKVKEAYENLIKQTIAQYEALVKAGYKFWFIDTNIPSNLEYAQSPFNAMRDIRSNKEMGVFPTTDGFGSSDIDVSDNPMMAETKFKWPVGGMDGELKPVLANDLFRAVHDAFGHGLEGAGFRARGEENAWQAHIRLFTGSAVGAITSETRGQNSWLNFGPYGESNRSANTEDTIFADQKTGLMPEWTWKEGVAPDMKEVTEEILPKGKKLSDMIRGLEIKGPGGLQSNLLGIPIAIWNSAVKTTAAAIDANVAVAKAIQQGVKEIKDWIKKNNPSLSLNDAKIKNTILVETYAGVIKTARANNIKNEGLTTYFKRKGLSDAQIAVLFKAEQKEATELSEKTIPGYTKLMNRINGIIERGRKDGKTDDVIMKGVIANVESRSPEYANANDQQREQIIRDIRKLFGKKEKAAPSAAKILGKPKPKKVTVDDMASLKDQLRLEARAAREAKGDLNTKRRMLADAIKKMQKKGKITVRQATALINKVNSVNLDNPIMVERLLDYAEKVFNNADYADRLSQANKLQSQIKQLSKNKEKFGNLTAFAAEFAKIDPALVENIDEYIEMASKVKEGVQGSKAVGGKVIPADMVDVGATMEYVNKTMKAQDESIRLKTAERLQELMGVDVSDLTMPQLQELMNLVKEEALAQGEQKDKLSDKINEIFGTNKEKEKAIRDGIQRMFDTYSTIIKDMFETGVDPFSDPDNPTTVDFKESDKKIVEEFMAMDLSLLDKKEALRAADALNNFLTNKSTAGMAAMLGEYDGRKNSKEVNEKGIRAKPIKMYWVPIFGRSFYEQFASIPLFFEKLFKGVTKGNYVREKMGINSLINHKAEALTLANRIINNYVIEFTKKKPNNKKFQDIYNIIERGIIGDLAKTIVGDEKQIAEEFNRRKKLIEETIQILEKGGTKKETKEAKVIKEVYDKIVKDSKTIEEVKAKADKINVDAVQFWVDQWAKLYDQFADVALNVYNKVLDKSVNYVPDRFGFLERSEKVTKDADGFESMFFANSNSEYFYKKEAGSLMKSQPPKSLFKDGKSDMYVNLSFDTNNANALLEALIDIKTARDIRQIQAFKNDPNFELIVPSGNDAKVLKERISALIRNIRNKRIITDKTFRQLTRNLDRFASFGAALALAGPTQAIKQTIPVAVNTLFNAGSLNLSVINNKDVNNFINNSGMAIANRGLDATTELETLNQKLEQSADTKAGDLIRAIENINKKFLKIFLSNFDVFIARASWITYYEKGLRKQGIKGKIDYSTHKINQQAADYAQTMVDRQQNISDKDLAGRMYESGNPMKQFIVKVFLPLATFRMNQTTRMMNDVTVITSKTSSLEDKKIALRSFAGYAAEMATFRAIGIGISYGLLYSIAQFIRGEDEDEEEKQKKFNNLIKGAATSVVSDVFSPMPQADMPVKYLFSSVLDQIQSIGDIKEEDRLNIFTENKESLSAAYGMFGIGLDKFNKLWEDVELGVTGKFKDDYGREKTIREKDRELLTNPLYVAIHLTSDFGISPFGPETNNVMNNITKMIKKDAMTEKQLEEYKETGEYPTKKTEKEKEEEKVKKSEAYGGYETLKEFEEKDPIKYDEYSAPGGKLYEYKKKKEEEALEKNKDKLFWGLPSEEAFKKKYPKEWREKYGPGTAYYYEQRTPEMLQKKAQEKRDEAKRERERKMKEAIRKREENIRKALSK